jgi:hypothetical protein
MLRFVLTLGLLLIGAQAGAEERPKATLYKQPYCGCCDGHADHLRTNGYDVTVVQTENLTQVKQKHGVPQEFEGCHTIEVGGYVVEGHVPASIIRKLLRERPALRGISLPGMPDGSPGMSGTKKEPFVVYGFSSAGEKKVFATD